MGDRTPRRGLEEGQCASVIACVCRPTLYLAVGQMPLGVRVRWLGDEQLHPVSIRVLFIGSLPHL